MVNRFGVRVCISVARRANTIEAEKARDIALCKMRLRRQSWRAIGVFLGLSHEGARKRWMSLREDVREVYGRAEVG